MTDRPVIRTEILIEHSISSEMSEQASTDDTDEKLYTCPACDRKSLRRRHSNLHRNVVRRSKGNIHDPFVCDSDDCAWTGGDEHVASYRPVDQKLYDYNSAMGW